MKIRNFRVKDLFANLAFQGIMVKPQNANQEEARKEMNRRKKIQRRQLRKIEKLIKDNWKISIIIVDINGGANIELQKSS